MRAKWVYLFIGALLLSACGRTTAPATPPPTVASMSTVAAQAAPSAPGAVQLPTFVAEDHDHAPSAPEHLHLEDGSVLTTEGLPQEDELLAQLLSGEPSAVGSANASAQTVVLTVPTMF
ncbi:MAG: hypothetical protein ACRDIB_16100 [Ardenticatenaceae bacterium]